MFYESHFAPMSYRRKKCNFNSSQMHYSDAQTIHKKCVYFKKTMYQRRGKQTNKNSNRTGDEF